MGRGSFAVAYDRLCVLLGRKLSLRHRVAYQKEMELYEQEDPEITSQLIW